MSKLNTIRKYAEVLGKASKWKNSKDAIVNINSTSNSKTKKERIYEFYCALRILNDLTKNYNLEIKNNKHKNIFPKAPGSKRNYPFFLATSKSTNKPAFQICIGVDIQGKAGETSAPDVSFQLPKASLFPTYSDVVMISDAKFKHKILAKVADTEYYKVHGMVVNLGCEKVATKAKHIKFDKLIDFRSNCIITNGIEFNDNDNHHKLFHVREISNFEEGQIHKKFG